jgi:hypothetical protein
MPSTLVRSGILATLLAIAIFAASSQSQKALESRADGIYPWRFVDGMLVNDALGFQIRLPKCPDESHKYSVDCYESIYEVNVDGIRYEVSAQVCNRVMSQTGRHLTATGIDGSQMIMAVIPADERSFRLILETPDSESASAVGAEFFGSFKIFDPK